MALGGSEGSQGRGEGTRPSETGGRVHKAWGPAGPGQGRGVFTFWDLRLSDYYKCFINPEPEPSLPPWLCVQNNCPSSVFLLFSV